MIRIIHLGHGKEATEQFWVLAAEQMRREGKLPFAPKPGEHVGRRLREHLEVTNAGNR